MVHLYSILLQSANLLDSLKSSWPIFLAALVWIFLIMRPQSQARKKQSKFLEDLQKGEEIVTDSGIIGRVNKIEDDIITIQLEGKTFIRVLRSSLSETKTAAIRKSSDDK